MTDTGYSYLGIVLDEDFHMSFPFLFIDDGQLYMIPETSEAGEVRLYRCTNFPMTWEIDTILMKNINTVDSMLTKVRDNYFILTNPASQDGIKAGEELSIFSSRDLRTNTWEPLPNPTFATILDSKRSRNGGLFSYNGGCFAHHKCRILVSTEKPLKSVVYLSENNFRRRFVQKILPQFKNNLALLIIFHFMKLLLV